MTSIEVPGLFECHISPVMREGNMHVDAWHAEITLYGVAVWTRMFETDVLSLEDMERQTWEQFAHRLHDALIGVTA